MCLKNNIGSLYAPVWVPQHRPEGLGPTEGSRWQAWGALHVSTNLCSLHILGGHGSPQLTGSSTGLRDHA